MNISETIVDIVTNHPMDDTIDKDNPDSDKEEKIDDEDDDDDEDLEEDEEVLSGDEDWMTGK